MNDGRYDIYSTFHKLLRAMLFDASARLARTDFGAEDRASDALAGLRETLFELHEHASIEDAIVNPILREQDGALARELDLTHRSFDAATARIEDLAAEVAGAPPPARARIGASLYAAWNAFAADQLTHMAREERDANAVLWAQLYDHEIAELHAQLLATVPPARAAWQLEKLLPVISVPERVRVFRHASKSAAAPAVAAFRDIAARVLGASGLDQIERGAAV